MKQPSDLLGNVQNRGDFQALRERASQGQERKIPASHPIWDVWINIKSAWPTATTNWEDIPPLVWAYALEGLTPEQIATGNRNLVHHKSDFPPSVSVFRSLCLAKDPEASPDYGRRTLPPGLIEDETVKQKRQREGLERIREIMGILETKDEQ